MRRPSNCKFCHCPVNLEIDDSYAELGDPLKLIKFAACNLCADLKEERRKLETIIERFCSALLIKPKGLNVGQIREALFEITRRYARNISRFNRSTVMIWDEAFAELLIERPDRWGMILGKYRSDCLKQTKTQPMAAPALAYKDDN